MKEDEADIVCCRWVTINRGLISGVSGYEFAEQKKILSNLIWQNFMCNLWIGQFGINY